MKLEFLQIRASALASIALSLLFVAGSSLVRAADGCMPLQAITITGTVSDDAGQPLPGVNIVEKGTTNGTTTDANGNYSLLVADQQAVLIFSFIGYETIEMPFGNRSQINVTLKADVQTLGEVVVVGYGTQRKSDLTGALSSVSAEQIYKATPTSLENALQGRAAGVVVTQASSAPGGGISVRIRGGNSILGGNEPLYVVDGVPIYNNNNEVNPGGGAFNELRTAPNALSSINPNDIQSIEVLKDASATAIYGSRGANGVVLITTKQGREGRARIEFDVYKGVQNITEKIEVLGSSDLMRWANETNINQASLANPPATPVIPFDDASIAGPRYDTDWQNEILEENASISNYQLSLSGGTKATLYSVSANVFNQDGIVKNSGFKRYSLRLNFESEIKKWLKIGNNISLARTDNNQVFEGGSGNANSSALFSALVYVPMLPIYNENTLNYSIRGDANVPGYSTFNRLNPVHLVNETTDETVGDRVLGSLFADFAIAKGLSFRSTLGYDYDARERRFYFAGNKDPLDRRGVASLGNTEAFSMINSNMLTYNKQLGNHRLTLTGVYELQKRSTQRSFIENRIFDNDITMFYDISAGTQVGGAAVSSNFTEWTMASYLGRVNYAYNDKYLLTVSARADGSSKFGEDNKWGFFPSAAIAYNIDRESFITDLNVFSTLKLRASAGRTGNQEIGINQAVTRFSRGKYSFGGLDVNTYTPTVGNTALKWETTDQYDVGIDMGFFDGRLDLSVDAYQKNTQDLLLTYTVTSETGYGSTTGNVGTLENKGIELTLGGFLLDKADLKWRTDLNYAANRNEVTNLGKLRELRASQGYSYDYGGDFNAGSLVRVGEPIGSFFGIIYDGVYQTEAELAGAPKNGTTAPVVGSAKYRDISGPLDANGNYTAPDGIVNQHDRVLLGNPAPKFTYGINNTITYKFLELSVFFQGVYGNKVLNLNRRDLYDDVAAHNISQDRFDNAWRNEGTIAKYPKAGSPVGIVAGLPGGAYSSFFIEDGSFLRLRNVRLSVDLPLKMLTDQGVNAKVYFAGQNLLTFTKYSGYNPEVNQQGQSNVNQGVDMGSYPLAKTYMVGLNLTF